MMYIFGNRSGQYGWEDHRPRSGVWKGSNGGEVISFSGCDDNQTSADTSVSSGLMIGNVMFDSLWHTKLILAGKFF